MSADKLEPTERHLVYEKVTGETGIWIADADGSEPRLLVRDGTRPRISPDGKWVAFFETCGDESHECLYVSPTSRGERRLLASGFWAFAWSPSSGRLLAERTEEDGLSETLVTIDVASGRETTVAKGPLFRGWSFSPDGEEVVFALERDPMNRPDQTDLFVVARDGGNVKQVTDDGASAFPVWGPKSIAFAKLIPHEGWGRNEIWRIQPDGTGRTAITAPLPNRFVKPHCIGLKPVEWSPDGRELLASWECEAVGESVAVDPQTGETRSLGEGSFTVALSQDGRFALTQWGDERVGQERQTVLVYPYAGGKADVIATGAQSPSWNR